MIKSMTGFGREHIITDDNNREIVIEIRSVNHRFFEFSAKIPRAYGYIEDKIKELIKNCITRGKVDVSVTIINQAETDAEIELNMQAAKGYLNALRNCADELDVDDDITLADIAKLPDVFNVVKKIPDEEIIWNQVKSATENALNKFVDMRITEGQKMYDDISGRLDIIEKSIGKIEEKSPETTENYRERLYNKIKEVLNNTEIDDSRILTEVAVFSDKIAVDEETVRLRSHISQFRTFLDSDEPIGRKLDFLVQEINREINTIGSKAQNLDITKIVVDLKSEVEKIREQIQNIE